MAEFQWWLLLVGLVAGGGLVAVVFLDGARRDQDIEDAELPAEARWIAARLGRARDLEPGDVEAVLREHREYRLLPPPDRLEAVDKPLDPAAPATARLVARSSPAAATAPATNATGTAPAESGRDAPTADA
jgi:hypothetical protein